MEIYYSISLMLISRLEFSGHGHGSRGFSRSVGPHETDLHWLLGRAEYPQKFAPRFAACSRREATACSLGDVLVHAPGHGAAGKGRGEGNKGKRPGSPENPLVSAMTAASIFAKPATSLITGRAEGINDTGIPHLHHHLGPGLPDYRVIARERRLNDLPAALLSPSAVSFIRIQSNSVRTRKLAVMKRKNIKFLERFQERKWGEGFIFMPGIPAPGQDGPGPGKSGVGVRSG